MIKNTFSQSFYFVLTLVISFVAFTSCTPKDSTTANAATTTNSASSTSSIEGDIAYVNIDSLALQYDLYVEIKEKSERVQLAANRELEQSQVNLQSEAESFQKRYQQGLLSENAAKKEQQDLQTKAQMLERQNFSKREAMRLQDEKDMEKIFSTIETVLEEYKAEKGYKVVLGTQKGAAMILYADKNLDITKPVLERLNAKYKTEKDSTETVK